MFAAELSKPDQALVYLRKAESVYPRDRRILFQLGKTLMLHKRYQDAIDVLRRGVQIDPESYQIHYQLSLCYDALGDKEKARHENQLHERFRPRIAAPFGRARPEHDNERHPIHEHASYPLGRIPANLSPGELKQMSVQIDR